MRKQAFKVPITPVMRKKKYDGNKEFFNFLASNSCVHYDWMLTSVFYAALHLVEKGLRDVGKESIDHKHRNNMVINEKILGQDVADAYRALFNESIVARYDCLPIDKKRAYDALKSLATIEKHINII